MRLRTIYESQVSEDSLDDLNLDVKYVGKINPDDKYFKLYFYDSKKYDDRTKKNIVDKFSKVALDSRLITGDTRTSPYYYIRTSNDRESILELLKTLYELGINDSSYETSNHKDPNETWWKGLRYIKFYLPNSMYFHGYNYKPNDIYNNKFKNIYESDSSTSDKFYEEVKFNTPESDILSMIFKYLKVVKGQSDKFCKYWRNKINSIRTYQGDNSLYMVFNGIPKTDKELRDEKSERGYIWSDNYSLPDYDLEGRTFADLGEQFYNHIKRIQDDYVGLGKNPIVPIDG